MLKWEYYEQGYCAKAESEFGTYRAFSDLTWWLERVGEFRAVGTNWCENQVEVSIAACEDDYARRVTEIAATNGYQRVGADQIVVRRVSLCAVVKPNYQSRECSCEECTAYRELLATLDETGKVTP